MKSAWHHTLLGILFSLATAAVAAPGEYWEYTMKMEMAGMPMAMPATTNKVCVAKGQEQDPRSTAEKDCTVTDVKTTGNKTTWRMQCTRKGETITGVGEMTGTPDNSEGKMRITGTMDGEKIDMTQTYKNRRIGGACDSDALAKQAQAIADQNTARACDTTGFNTQRWLQNSHFYVDAKPVCAAKKDAFCEVVRRDVPRNVNDYLTYRMADKDKGRVSAACGISAEATRKSICKALDANSNDIRAQLRAPGAYQGMQAECPAEMKVYAEVTRKRFCEGRSFTARQKVSMADCLRGTGEADDDADADSTASSGSSGSAGNSAARKNRPAAVGGNAAAAPAAPAAAPESAPSNLPSIPGVDNPAGAILDGAKKLKGLFSF